MNIMYSLLLLSSLLHITTCTVYTVTPDDHYYPNTTCNHCHNLQHYLLNITKYFTSNTQLLFLPGLHHLHTHLIIQNVHNISLIGSTANGTTLDTVIQCNSSVGILMNNITNLTMNNMIIKDCAANFTLQDIQLPNEQYVVLSNCFQVHIQHITITCTHEKGGLLTFNTLGKTVLDNIKSDVLRIVYNDSNLATALLEQNELSVHKFQLIPYNYNKYTGSVSPSPYGHNNKTYDIVDTFNYIYNYNYHWIRILKDRSAPVVVVHLLQTLFNVTVKFSNSRFKNLKHYKKIMSFTLNVCLRNVQNVINIKHCNFENNYSYNVISISSLPCTGKKLNENRNLIKISYCKFIENRSDLNVFHIITVEDINAFFHIFACVFQNTEMPIIKILSATQESCLTITKSHFLTSNKFLRQVINLVNVKLIFEGPIIFNSYVTDNLIKTNTLIVFHNYIEFSNLKVETLIQGTSSYNIYLLNNVYVNITNNRITEAVFSMNDNESVLYRSCYFQYFNTVDNFTGSTVFIGANNAGMHKIQVAVFDNATSNINCKWEPGSLYYGTNPVDIYKKQFQTVNEYSPFNTGLLCYCPDNETQANCYTNVLKSLYPGQTLTLYLALNPNATNEDSVPVTVKMYDKDFPNSVCGVSTLLEAEQLVKNNCTKLIYNIFSENQKQCKLILYSTEYKYPTVYYINLLNCPVGFSFSANAKKCICAPELKSEILLTDNCNINDQTILRPANSWISATTHNNSYTYHISLHCPFHYCLPHSSHLNFSTPNSQCQFNRSGLLCGHCQQGLSTVFGSSRCQNCSNVYIILTVVLAIAGVVLVFLMFILNLTVVDGTINAFVFYVNIIYMNSSILFPVFTPTYTFISLANLDLGIQTCFYNGMDDYAKMWLQLAFPFYLIFIATLIIITSRHSTKIQRLTARRALPVLATLFLLSYTKILRIVSSVSFSYSTITHLPSKHTTLVWSVDANVPLFGVRFTILFIVCFILFILFILFNVVLLFNKILTKLRIFVILRSLLDTYQRPYKEKFYYWTSLQLTIRVVLFGISSLERNVNLTITIILLSVMEGAQCTLKPFKNKVLNYQELLFVLNILWLCAYALFSETVNMMVINTMITAAALHFTIIIIYHIISCVTEAGITNKAWKNFCRIGH